MRTLRWFLFILNLNLGITGSDCFADLLLFLLIIIYFLSFFLLYFLLLLIWAFHNFFTLNDPLVRLNFFNWIGFYWLAIHFIIFLLFFKNMRVIFCGFLFGIFSCLFLIILRNSNRLSDFLILIWNSTVFLLIFWFIGILLVFFLLSRCFIGLSYFLLSLLCIRSMLIGYTYGLTYFFIHLPIVALLSSFLLIRLFFMRGSNIFLTFIRNSNRLTDFLRYLTISYFFNRFYFFFRLFFRNILIFLMVSIWNTYRLANFFIRFAIICFLFSLYLFWLFFRSSCHIILIVIWYTNRLTDLLWYLMIKNL